MVLKSGVYAVSTKQIEEKKGEFNVNTRTEWCVIYVDSFSLNLDIESSRPSLMPIKKRHISVERMSRFTDNSANAMEFDKNS